jgi:L-seryl-tRNA(Ser) seleniumtransferase
MLGTPAGELQQRAEALAARVRTLPGIAQARAVADVAYVGGGSLPDQTMPTWVVEVEARTVSDAQFAHRLRTGDPTVMARLRDGKVVLDVRTIFPEQEPALHAALAAASA